MSINPAYLSTEGKVWLQLGPLKGKPVFGDIDRRRELLRRFAVIARTDLRESVLEGYGSVPLALVAADPDGSEKLVAAFDWIVREVGTAT